METSRINEFLAEIIRLKALPRTGWLLRGVRDVESIADHTFGVVWVAMLLADLATARGMPVNIERVLRMALLHDVTEVRTGDLPSTIKSYFEAEMLKNADTTAAGEILAPLGELGEKYLEIWREYETRETIEARIVKAADKIDLLLQVREYENGGAKNLSEFGRNADEDFAKLGINELIADIVANLNN